MEQHPNVICYYLNEDLQVFNTTLSFAHSQNPGIDVYLEVDKHSKSLPVSGIRHDITFMDFSCHKYMSMPHMWPLEKYPIIITSEEDERKIIEQYNKSH